MQHTSGCGMTGWPPTRPHSSKSRGWRRGDAQTWSVGIGDEAFIEAYLHQWDPGQAATADVVACEEPP